MKPWRRLRRGLFALWAVSLAIGLISWACSSADRWRNPPGGIPVHPSGLPEVGGTYRHPLPPEPEDDEENEPEADAPDAAPRPEPEADAPDAVPRPEPEENPYSDRPVAVEADAAPAE